MRFMIFLVALALGIYVSVQRWRNVLPAPIRRLFKDHTKVN
jgi:hypothetical protein